MCVYKSTLEGGEASLVWCVGGFEVVLVVATEQSRGGRMWQIGLRFTIPVMVVVDSWAMVRRKKLITT